MKVKYFGDYEFLKFHMYLKNETTFKETYVKMVAMRRIMTSAHVEGFKFKLNPRHFTVPPRPAADHFEVLGNENLKVLKDFLKVEINKIYEREALFENAIANGSLIQELGSTFKATTDYKAPFSFYKWQVSLCDVLFQLYQEYPKYPNNSTKEQLSSGGEYSRLANIDYDKMDTAFKIIYKRMGIQNLANVLPFIKDGENLSFADCMGILYPRVFETYVIRWAICLETGWSPDMVARINIHDYLYSPIHINSSVSFLKTMKLKGINGSNDVSFKDAKLFVCPSSISDPLSAHNLIKLFNKRTSRLRTGRNYKIQVNEIGCEPFFLYLNPDQKSIILASHPDRTKKISSKDRSNYMKKNLGFNFDARQLRPTCLYQREKDQNLPVLVQVALFGHSTSAITEECYKSSAPFQQLRKDNLARELNQIQQSIKDGTFKGSLVPLKQGKKIEERIVTIFTDHSGESPLAFCNNPKKPDWEGHEAELEKKGYCKRFNKCLLCSCSTVFSDNIPFVVDRYLYLEQKRRELKYGDFIKLYNDEYLAAKEVIDSWPYKEEIKEAEERTLLEDYLLPPIISESF